ncbi:MAG: DUF6665 family protein [Alsobacter sp.]
MSFRLPQTLAGPARGQSGASVLDVEIAQQRAQTLGDLGHQVEQALQALRDHDADGRDREARERLLDAAADRVWALMVQRELSGLRHWDAVVKAYGVPREVLNRMGRVVR